MINNPDANKKLGGARAGAGRPAHDVKRSQHTMRAFDDEWEVINHVGFFIKALPVELSKSYVETMIAEKTAEKCNALIALTKAILQLPTDLSREEIRRNLDELILLTSIVQSLWRVPIEVAVSEIDMGGPGHVEVLLKENLEVAIMEAIALQNDLMKRLSWRS